MIKFSQDENGKYFSFGEEGADGRFYAEEVYAIWPDGKWEIVMSNTTPEGPVFV